MAMILNEEQTMLKDSAKDFCTTNAPIGQLRKLRDDANPDGFERGTWASMVELGWAAIPWDEEHGGLAFGYKGLGVVTEESGRTLTASPLYASVWVGGTLINVAGSDAQKAEMLPQLAAGEMLLALALEESHKHDPYGISTTATASGDGFILDGRKTFVLDGHVADKLIVVARTSAEVGSRQGLSLFMVDREAQGVAVTRTLMADSRNAANIALSNVQVGNDALLGALDGAADALDQALDIARIGLTAEMLGGIQECFERTVAYLKERKQFGVAIGSFQALKHRAADMFCEIELSKSCVLEALTALDEDRDREEVAKLASLAKAKVGETYNLVSREGIQMHGGIGMTDEFDIGFFIKRAAVAEQTFGDVNFHRNRYGELEGY
ncbi:MAG: acyl-CoA dehydrogenase family protein [Candidatus Azotimanducaceae bacterium]|jgi:acyl-CoA dehydrogenase|tara:strand:- start:1199 stop:2344 length:1146 start_codon:yes stop_codon:yes gene_type:complete